MELRQLRYEQIIDETLYICAASEGAVSTEWIMEQPIFIRKKYLKEYQNAMEERRTKMNANSNKIVKKNHSTSTYRSTVV